VKILVVDPEAEIRLLFFVASGELSCESFFAASGEEALDVWRDHDDIDVVLLSTELPDIAASALAQQLRLADQGAHVAIVFLSNSEDSELLVDLLKYGDDVVIKPFSQAVLLAKLLAMRRTRKLYQQVHEHNRELEKFRERTEAELQIASDVFACISALSIPAIAGVTRFQQACSSLGGDLLLMASRPGEGFNVLIADITGHGLPGALGTLPMAETFFAMSKKGFGVGAMAREMNKVFRKRMPDYMLCAAIMIAVRDRGQSLQIWSGGMPPCLVYGDDGKVREILRSSHMALGALTDAEFDESLVSVKLEIGEQVFCFSDGITDATNENGDMFGHLEFIPALEGPIALNVVERIVQRLRAFVPDGKMDDDITLFSFSNREYMQALAQLANSADDQGLNGFNWRVNFRFEAEQLRNDSPLDLIFTSLPEHPLIRAARADLSFIVNELFVNALDHGVLRLESALKEQQDGMFEYFEQRVNRLSELSEGFVDLEVSCKVNDNIGKFCIVCRDSGPGFDLCAVLASAIDDSHHSGRGLSTIAALCDELKAGGDSNSIAAFYHWPRVRPETTSMGAAH